MEDFGVRLRRLRFSYDRWPIPEFHWNRGTSALALQREYVEDEQRGAEARGLMTGDGEAVRVAWKGGGQ